MFPKKAGKTLIKTIVGKFYPNAKNFNNLSCGRHALVYRFKAGQKEIIIKILPKEFSLESELFFLEITNPLKITPKVYKFDKKKNFLIMEYIAGRSGDKNLSKGAKIKLYHSLGQAVKKIHQIKVNGAGYRRNGRFMCNSIIAGLQKEFLKIIKDTKLINDLSLAEKDVSAIRRFIPRLADGNFSLLHGDLHLENTIHKKGRILAIIDPGLPRGGNPCLDLGILFNRLKKRRASKEFLSAFANGYGRINWSSKEIIFYALFREIMELDFFKKFDQKEYQNRLKMGKKEIHKRISYLRGR